MNADRRLEPELINSERPMPSTGNRPNAECGCCARPPGCCARPLPSKSDQIRPKNELRWTGTYGPAGTVMDKALQIVAEGMVGRSSRDCGRARWRRGKAERRNGKAKYLNDRNTFFTCFTDERGAGISEQSSLMFAYVRVCSLNGRKNIAGAARGHCASRPSVRPGIVPLAPLRATCFISDKVGKIPLCRSQGQSSPLFLCHGSKSGIRVLGCKYGCAGRG